MKDKTPASIGGLMPRFKLWLSSPCAEGVFGDGKWRLLKAIKQTSSLREAAARLGMSYRKAWGDLKKAESCLRIKFVEKRRGGTGGGETRLTEAGKAWVAAYGRFRAKVERVVAAEFAKQLGQVRKNRKKSDV